MAHLVGAMHHSQSGARLAIASIKSTIYRVAVCPTPPRGAESGFLAICHHSHAWVRQHCAGAVPEPAETP